MLGTTAVPDPMKNFYSFTTQVMVDEQTAVIGRIDAGGTVEARVHRGWLQSEDLQVATKVVAVATPEFNENNQMVMDVDVGGKTWSGQVSRLVLDGDGSGDDRELFYSKSRCEQRSSPLL